MCQCSGITLSRNICDVTGRPAVIHSEHIFHAAVLFTSELWWEAKPSLKAKVVETLSSDKREVCALVWLRSSHSWLGLCIRLQAKNISRMQILQDFWLFDFFSQMLCYWLKPLPRTVTQLLHTKVEYSKYLASLRCSVYDINHKQNIVQSYLIFCLISTVLL